MAHARTVTCFSCRKKGHYATTCPARRGPKPPKGATPYPVRDVDRRKREVLAEAATAGRRRGDGGGGSGGGGGGGEGTGFFTYGVKCGGGVVYNGATTNPERRLTQHFSGTGSAVTQMAGAKEVLWVKRHASEAAMKRAEVKEYRKSADVNGVENARGAGHTRTDTLGACYTCGRTGHWAPNCPSGDDSGEGDGGDDGSGEGGDDDVEGDDDGANDDGGSIGEGDDNDGDDDVGEGDANDSGEEDGDGEDE
jgi:predicted GIY-YIG superfamily endonuclease